MPPQEDGGLAICFFIVKVNDSGKPVVTNRLDLKDDAEELTASRVETFCFPEYEEGSSKLEKLTRLEPEAYTFVLTRDDGQRVLGFCRRNLQTGSDPRHPQVTCILSEIPWFSFFSKALCTLDSLVDGLGTEKFLSFTCNAALFMRELCLRPKPTAGEVIAGGQSFPIPSSRGSGEQNADVYFAPLLWRVPVRSVVALLASLLMERRVVIIGGDRCSLSHAVHAAHALLHPLQWQHIFLPVLPHAMLDYLTAPMPFIIGVPAALAPCMRALPMEEIVVLDLDTGACDYFTEDLATMPKRPLRALEADLNQALQR